ncbi:hypothetical protein SLEP1_g28992 [Rubroshorea leprosula]|uniref:Carboxypeptidase n=1 Tax=Rubroshorea leprosula TaxID=152421 RepID=A0AAV5K1K5_9ROSI|nr:hypothetical protein SLEP1_g28992 [Rubroshorea leprosula]
MDFTLKVAVFLTLAFISSILVQPVSGVRNSQLSRRKNRGTYGNEDMVTNLPGQPAVDFRHYVAYVTVDEKNGRTLFYWFYEATTRPDEKTLVLWLNGGPGCSSVGYGATQEIGPFLVDIEGNGIKFNNYSWNKEANMLFLESPIRVGFSYTNTSTDYDNLGDAFTANDAYTFLHKWLLKFPSYRTRTFYIAGESHAGKYVPELAELIIDKNSDPSLYIDLKGILLGNPETSSAEDWRGLVDYAWSHTVVPRILGGYDPCLDSYAKAFYNRPDVQESLHVSNGHQLRNWSICNHTMFENWSESDSKKICSSNIQKAYCSWS